MKKKYKRPLLLALAIIFLFESWLWEITGRTVAWCLRNFPFQQQARDLVGRIEMLSPVNTLWLFIIPVLVLLPLKFVALYMLAQGSIFSGILTIIFAKLAGFGVTSFLFTLCKPKLLQVRWVKWAYEHCLVWRHKAHELVKPYMRYVRNYIKLLKPQRQNVVGKLRTQVHKMRQ
jgi:hypothetical protein